MSKFDEIQCLADFLLLKQRPWSSAVKDKVVSGWLIMLCDVLNACGP